jgi:hypothetical protein
MLLLLLLLWGQPWLLQGLRGLPGRQQQQVEGTPLHNMLHVAGWSWRVLQVDPL